MVFWLKSSVELQEEDPKEEEDEDEKEEDEDNDDDSPPPKWVRIMFRLSSLQLVCSFNSLG